MNRYNKTLRWTLLTIVFIVGAIIIFLALAPRLVNMEPIRKAIIAAISREAGAEIKFQEISLSFLPRPRVDVTNGSFSMPETLRASFKSFSVFPKLFPILTGNIEIGKLFIGEPDVDITVSEKAAQTEGGRKAPVDKIIQETIAPVVGVITALGKDLDITLANGRVKITRKDKSFIRITDIDVHIVFPSDTLNINFKSKADFCEKIVLKASIHPKAFKSHGKIELFRLRPHRLPANLISAGDMRIEESLVDLSLKFNTDRFDVIQADLEGTLAMLTVQRGKNQFVFKGQALKGRFQMSNKKIDVNLTELKLERPQLTCSGTFSWEQDSGKMRVDLKVIDVDIPSTRQAALKLTGDIAEVKEVFDIIQKGKIPAIRFNTHGHSVQDLGTLENMNLTANLLQGEVFVPGVLINTTGVSAEVALAKGLLSADKIKASYGNTRVLNGSMRLGLSGNKIPFDLNIRLDADLVQVPPLLKQVVKDRRFLDELDRIQDISGRAEGRLILGEMLDDINPAVSVSDFKLSARMLLLPHRLELSGRDFTYNGVLVTLKHLDGRIKNSDFTLEDITINSQKTPVIRIRSGKGRGNLNEIYDWLATQQSLRKSLKDIQALTGSIKLSQLELNGPLDSPLKWNYQLAGSLENILVKSHMLQAPLSVRRGIFMTTPEMLTFTGAETHIMDTSMTVSGVLKGYREGLHQASLAVQGVIGEKGDKWLIKTFHLPSHFVLRPPLTLANGRFSWDRHRHSAFAGDLTIDKDLQLSADVLLEGNKIDIKKFFIQDKNSRAVFSFAFDQKKEIDFSFKGNIKKSTVDRLLVDNQNVHGWIKGDLRLKYFKDQPMVSKFEGNLSAQDLILLKHLNIPLKVNSLSIEGVANKFQVAADMYFQQDQRVKMKGNVNYSPQGIVFDTDLHSNGISVDDLLAAVGQNENKKNGVQKSTFWDFPLEGVVRLDAAYVKYGEFAWQPVRATVTLHPEKITVAVGGASLCGIATPGTLTLYPNEVQLSVTPAAKNQDLNTSLPCLGDKTAKFQGSFDLTGEIKGQGHPQDLLKSLSGKIEFNSNGGRIEQGRTFRNISTVLKLLNVTEVFRGKLPDLGEEGFVYNSAKAKIKIENNSIIIEEGVLDGKVMNIVYTGVITLADKKVDGTALVAPLKTVDSIVKHIPIVGYVLGGNLISIAFSLKGDINDPEIGFLPPTAVGEGLVGMMKRTLNLPLKIIDFFTPEKKD